jgi:triacylglycerol lipase
MRRLPPQLDLDLARLCAQTCAASYETWSISDPCSDTQVLIRELPRHVIVSFRGTSSIKDWLSDACFWMVEYHQGRVHAGFLRAIKPVRNRLLTRLQDCDKPVLITGHSLGGALAMLFADWLDRYCVLNTPFQGVYTFGQPRVGDGRFAESYNGRIGDRTWRFINAEDVVPRVPGWLQGYRHAGQRMFITSAGRLEWSPSLWLMAFSDVTGMLESWTLRRELTLLTHHGIGRYLTALANLS